MRRKYWMLTQTWKSARFRQTGAQNRRAAIVCGSRCRCPAGPGKTSSEMVRQEGKGLNPQFNSLSDEEWSILFDTLEEWERYFAQLDLKSLRCDDEHFRL